MERIDSIHLTNFLIHFPKVNWTNFALFHSFSGKDLGYAIDAVLFSLSFFLYLSLSRSPTQTKPFHVVVVVIVCCCWWCIINKTVCYCPLSIHTETNTCISLSMVCLRGLFHTHAFVSEHLQSHPWRKDFWSIFLLNHFHINCQEETRIWEQFMLLHPLSSFNQRCLSYNKNLIHLSAPIVSLC